MIAPTMLVAANVIPRSIKPVNIAPSIPVNKTDNIGQIQNLSVSLVRAAAIRVIARYTTEIPNITNKNTGVSVIVAVIRRNAAIIPTIMLARMATNGHESLQLQLYILDSPPSIIYDLN